MPGARAHVNQGVVITNPSAVSGSPQELSLPFKLWNNVNSYNTVLLDGIWTALQIHGGGPNQIWKRNSWLLLDFHFKFVQFSFEKSTCWMDLTGESTSGLQILNRGEILAQPSPRGGWYFNTELIQFVPYLLLTWTRNTHHHRIL